MGRVWAALAICVSTLGISSESRGWTGLDEKPFPYWGSVPVKYFVNKASFPSNMATTAEQRLISGFASWSAPNCTYFETLLVGDLPESTFDVNDGKNVVLWINKPNSWPAQLGPEDSVIGVTMPIWSNDGMGHIFLDDADIIFNNIGFCWYDFDPANPDITCSGGKPVDTLSIVTHEQGHFLGLGHTNVAGATMEPAYLGGNDLATIEQDDIDGVCALYPLGGATAPGANCDACRENAQQNQCFTAAKACTSSCLGLGDCVIGCPRNDVDAYEVCATQCTKQFKDGLMAYTAYTNCLCSVCAEPCATQCGGPTDACATNAGGASNEGGQERVCKTPQFTGQGGCGCAFIGREEDIDAWAMLGLAFGALVMKRRRR